MILSDVTDELELTSRFSRSRFVQSRALGPFAPLALDTTRRTEEVVLGWRHAVTHGLDLTVEVPRLSLREAQPTRVPANAVSTADVQEQYFTSSGLGDVRLRLSRELFGRQEPLRSHALDLLVKLDTGRSDFQDGTSLLSPGSGQRDWGLGYRAKQSFPGWTGSVRLARTFSSAGLRKRSDGTTLELQPGDRWTYGLRAERAFRSWLVGSLELTGFLAERARLGGLELQGSAADFLAAQPSVTVSVTDDFEVAVFGELPVRATGEPSDGAYGFTLRERF